MHTKIVCTLGPASHTASRIDELVQAGMDCARLNMSHGSYAHHAQTIHLVRQAAVKAGRTVSLLADLQGPKIRVGRFKQGSILLKPGQTFILTTKRREGDEKGASVSYKPLPDEVKVGGRIFLADGNLEMVVIETRQQEVVAQVLKGGVLRDHQGLNLPGATLSTEAMTPKDRLDVQFALDQNVDFIALSFVRTARDIMILRELTQTHPSPPFLVAKIEKPEALDNLHEILDATDGVMVARGDLGVEMPLAEVPRAQRRIIREAGARAKFVITATQMLESMIDHARPTRAEVTDIAAAVLDGTDALMLSGETAMGNYPVQAVRTMKEIATVTEDRPDFNPFVDEYIGVNDFMQAAAAAAAEAARRLSVRAVISLTQNGMMPRLLSHQHFRMPVLAASEDEGLLRRLSLVWGVVPLLCDKSKGHDAQFKTAIATAKARSLVQAGDSVVVTFGMAPTKINTGNVIRLHRVE